ncbi:nitroreductase family protein [Dysosmobacter sp.]|uniref:nitroreductase family protein n=1 Tax=Dysosmobacter sp. TaxID=2591382 RepID=UPI002A8F55DD|nr:nitroreductase family protein [Dysosmobacter sp.]MDY3281453.1 nitroreductase family protein [Dysosmobacter sp.]
MDFKELAQARYSLRKFSDKPVEQEKLDLILEAARCAPTAHNLQPQRVLVLRSPEAREKAHRATPFRFGEPVLLMVACDEAASWHRECDNKAHGQIDAAIAVTQMMLQAADLGLGTTYVGVFDPEVLHAEFPEELKGLTPIALLPLGYPAEGAHPSRLHADRKPLEEIVKYL